jgi:uncharacterized membrane protein YgaE (UPF0421/DUF939 family)
MKQSLAIQLHHTNSITILKLVINLISSSISIIRVLAFVELINIVVGLERGKSLVCHPSINS